jgi:predicted ATPase
LLFRQGVPPHASYLFKHALVQDTAYGTLLREPRRTLHARIADTLESQFAEIAEHQPELLARHCTEAGLTARAIVYWVRAGQRAVERSANAEAIRHLGHALDLLSPEPETRSARSRSWRCRCCWPRRSWPQEAWPPPRSSEPTPELASCARSSD